MFITSEEGWTFEAGVLGVMDVRRSDYTVAVYLPAVARSLAISHPVHSRMEWAIPEALEEGAAYSAVLKGEERRRPAPAPTPAPSFRVEEKSPFHFPDLADIDNGEGFCTSFLTLSLGFDFDELCSASLKYTYINERIGPYFGFGVNYDGGGMFLCGAAFRLTDEYKTGLDLQYYLGLGLGEPVTIDTGVRFAFRSSVSLSQWDIGVGVQLCCGELLPTVELGFFIWGVPVLLGLGLVLGG